MPGVGEFLGAQLGNYAEDGRGQTEFRLGSDLHGAFGGVFGGAVAAASVYAARPAAPGRRVTSLHVSFLRGLATDTCRAEAEVVSVGRTMTTVSVDLADADGRRTSRATVGFAAPEALHPLDAPGYLDPGEFSRYEQGTTIKMGGAGAPPIVEQMAPRMVGFPAGGYAHAVRVPWDADPAAGAEAVCMAADFCVGIPVGAALDEWRPIPNPDLSLRFAGGEVGEVLVGVGRLARIDAGAVATSVEVWSPDAASLLAIGLSSAVVLGGTPREQ